MQRSKSIALTGTYQNLKTLVSAALVSDGEAPWMDSGFALEIYSPRTNASGTRIQTTSDPIDQIAAKEALPEASIDYNSGGAVHNSVTLLDKLIRIVDSADLSTTGTAVVSFEWA